jgi:hypothetical protein
MTKTKHDDLQILIRQTVAVWPISEFSLMCVFSHTSKGENGTVLCRRNNTVKGKTQTLYRAWKEYRIEGSKEQSTGKGMNTVQGKK